jgi:predicted nucleic acid-binding protein
MLTDTGPIVSLLDDDPGYSACLTVFTRLPAAPLLTTWPCFTEAMYLLGKNGGYRYQAKLWQWHSARRVILHEATSNETARMAELMRKYRDVPMDLADASLMAAESIGTKRIFTLDSDFRFYLLANGAALEVIP